MIEEALLQHLKFNKIDPKINQNKYKVKFTQEGKDQNGQEYQIQICVRILQVQDKQYCVEFQRISGDQFRYHEYFNEFKDEYLKPFNDAQMAA